MNSEDATTSTPLPEPDPATQRTDPRILHTEILSLRNEVAMLRRNYEGLQDMFHRVVHGILIACEFEHGEVSSHLKRMGRYCRTLGEKLGFSTNELNELEWAAALHDIGNVGVPAQLLQKPGRLTDREFTLVKAHTVIGGRLLADSQVGLLARAREIALSHHERWDGKGYPAGLKHRQIPLNARIVCIVDNFDALTSSRPHKMAYPVDIACDIIQSQRERIFDPELVPPLRDCLDLLIRAKAQIDTPENMPGTNFAFSERDCLHLDTSA